MEFFATTVNISKWLFINISRIPTINAARLLNPPLIIRWLYQHFYIRDVFSRNFECKCKYILNCKYRYFYQLWRGGISQKCTQWSQHFYWHADTHYPDLLNTTHQIRSDLKVTLYQCHQSSLQYMQVLCLFKRIVNLLSCDS